MNWYSQILNENQIKSISEQVTEAERSVHAEIVPILVKSSSTTGHVPIVLSMIFILTLLSIHHPITEFLFLYPTNFSWLFILPFFFFLSLWISKKSMWIQRSLTSEFDKELQTRRRAILEFYLNRVFRTGNRNGILIFVSLMERKALVYADEGLTQILTEESRQDILRALLFHLKNGDVHGAFIAAIQKSGELLKPHCPVVKNSNNELNNQLIIKD